MRQATSRSSTAARTGAPCRATDIPPESRPEGPTDIPPESRPEPEAATFNAHLPMHMKKVLQRAADIRHQTLTEFVLGSAYDRAMTTLPVRVATAGPRHENRLGR
jgi:hypothetical protein